VLPPRHDEVVAQDVRKAVENDKEVPSEASEGVMQRKVAHMAELESKEPNEGRPQAA
jgi:hypothetical protein